MIASKYIKWIPTNDLKVHVTNDKTAKMLAWNAMWKFSDVPEIYQRSNEKSSMS